jgi:hypothetical protein
MITKIRAMLLEMFQRQMKTDTGISTRGSLYMVEVQLLEDFVNVITGNALVLGDHYDEIHDACCDFIDSIHKYDQ